MLLNTAILGLNSSSFLMRFSFPSKISFFDKSDMPLVVLGTISVKPMPRSKSLASSWALNGSGKNPDKYKAFQK